VIALFSVLTIGVLVNDRHGEDAPVRRRRSLRSHAKVVRVHDRPEVDSANQSSAPQVMTLTVPALR
jgi:hypothetical protein